MTATQKIEDWTKLAEIIKHPETPEEAILLIGAFIHLDRYELALGVLNSRQDIDRGTRNGLEERIETLRLRRKS